MILITPAYNIEDNGEMLGTIKYSHLTDSYYLHVKSQGTTIFSSDQLKAVWNKVEELNSGTISEKK